MKELIHFRTEDIGKEKRKLLIDEGKRINPNLKIESYKAKIEEDVMANNDKLWTSIDAVVCALDYRFSKNYVNNQSLWYEKPMICCTAHSLKCASQITLPKVTEGYTENSILNPQKHDLNTVRNFPYTFEHTITWATEIFQRFISKTAEMIEAIAQDRELFAKQQEVKELKEEISSQKVFRVSLQISILTF
jgi:ubiquitin-activating enzyme E1